MTLPPGFTLPPSITLPPGITLPPTASLLAGLPKSLTDILPIEVTEALTYLMKGIQTLPAHLADVTLPPGFTLPPWVRLPHGITLPPHGTTTTTTPPPPRPVLNLKVCPCPGYGTRGRIFAGPEDSESCTVVLLNHVPNVFVVLLRFGSSCLILRRVHAIIFKHPPLYYFCSTFDLRGKGRSTITAEGSTGPCTVSGTKCVEGCQTGYTNSSTGCNSCDRANGYYNARGGTCQQPACPCEHGPSTNYSANATLCNSTRQCVLGCHEGWEGSRCHIPKCTLPAPAPNAHYIAPNASMNGTCTNGTTFLKGRSCVMQCNPGYYNSYSVGDLFPILPGPPCYRTSSNWTARCSVHSALPRRGPARVSLTCQRDLTRFFHPGALSPNPTASHPVGLQTKNAFTPWYEKIECVQNVCPGQSAANNRTDWNCAEVTGASCPVGGLNLRGGKNIGQVAPHVSSHLDHSCD